jgi:WD40 repeat protein
MATLFDDQGQPLRHLSTNEIPLGFHIAQLSPDGRMAATGGCANVSEGNTCFTSDIIVWDTDTGSVRHHLRGHESWIVELQFSRAGDTLISASMDGTVRTWDLKSGEQVKEITFPCDQLRDLAINADQTVAFAGDWDGTLRFINLVTGQVLHEVRGDPLPGTSAWLDSVGLLLDVDLSPDGRFAISVAGSRAPILWDVQSGQQVLRFSGYEGKDWVLSFSPDSKRVATASSDGYVRLWDVKTGVEYRRYTFPKGEIHSITFGPDTTYLLIGSYDGVIRKQPLELSLDKLISWTCANRHVSELRPEIDQAYDLQGMSVCLGQ